MQRFTNFGDHPGEAAGIVGLVKMAENIFDPLVPKPGTHFFMDAFVAKEGKLAVLESDIDQHAIAGGRLFHVETGENLGGPMQGVDIAAAAFDIYPDLAAGALFRVLDGRYDLLLLRLVKKLLFRKVWNMQRKNLNV